MSIINKRLRAPNFTTGEGLQLCNIIERYKSIIENKATDGASLQQKQKAWIDIARDYHATGPNFVRTVESLQNFYKKLKQKAKKQHSTVKMNIPVNKEKLLNAIEENGLENWDAVSTEIQLPKEECETAFNILIKEAKKNEADIKKSVMGTGGGPPSNNEDALLDKVKGLIKGSVEGMYTIFDGDAELMAECSITNPIDAVICTDTEAKSIINESSVDHVPIAITPKTHVAQDDMPSYFSNNRANLKKKPHDLLTSKRKLKIQNSEKQSVSEKFKVLAADKTELIALQKELLKIQLAEEQQKMEHNRILRAMEMEDAKAKYAHNEKLRQLELEFMLNKQV